VGKDDANITSTDKRNGTQTSREHYSSPANLAWQRHRDWWGWWNESASW